MSYSSAITKVTSTKSPLNMSTPNIDINSRRNQLLEIRKNIQKIETDNIQRAEDYLSMERRIFNLELEKEMRPSIGEQDDLEQWITSIRAKFERDYIEVLDLVDKLENKVAKLQSEREKRYEHLTSCIEFILKGKTTQVRRLINLIRLSTQEE